MVVVCFVVADADDVDGLAGLDDAALDPAGDDGATTGDREDVLDRHQERLLGLALRLRDVLVDRVHQLEDGLAPLGVTVHGREGGDPDDRDVVAVELYSLEQLADLELDELDELLVVDHVALVQRDDDRRHADLTGQQHVLAGLRHRAVGGGHHQDRAVHLGRTGDHVLDVVGVTRAVDVRVVTLLGLVLDVRDRDRDTALALFRRLVDLVEGRNRVQLGYLSWSTLVIAAVSVVLPWSMCPMVPMLQCGLVRSNLAFATEAPSGLFATRVRGALSWL